MQVAPGKPSQALLQQTLLTQKPLPHWATELHAEPLPSFGLHVLEAASQKCVGRQSLSPVQVFLQPAEPSGQE